MPRETDTPAGVPGRLLHSDCTADKHCVYQSDVSRNGPKNQRLFFRRPGDASAGEINALRDMTNLSATLVTRQGKYMLVVHRWNSYYPVTPATFVRILKGINDPSMRPEDALLLLDPDSDAAEYLGPGSGVVPSPDRKKAAFLRSEGGFHSIHVWDSGSGSIDTVMSLWEADPGSGVSFNYRWSTDSRLLLIDGHAVLSHRDHNERADHTALPLVYKTKSMSLYEAP